MEVPKSHYISTAKLGNVFNDTTATYKFYWFLSIIQLHTTERRSSFSVWDIISRMVANAWYPINYFRLSFGYSDSLFRIVKDIREYTGIPIDANLEEVYGEIRERLSDKSVKDILNRLTLNVPFRFLHPWLKCRDNKQTVFLSQNFTNDCLYAIIPDEDKFRIEINPLWDDYLYEHNSILTDFAYWNLTQFVQKRNPNVPAISDKLIKKETRNSLTRQHKYWNMVIEIGGPIKCIYTGQTISDLSYDLDHFMPWSFVAHDLLWNLIPADGSINSSKSNKLPPLDIYLARHADMQYHAIHTLRKAGQPDKLFDDYLSLGYCIDELMAMPTDIFREVFRQTYTPISQIAQNMGYETWQIPINPE